eukprot:14898603-Alexandrium_andersonii.AAC.1
MRRFLQRSLLSLRKFTTASARPPRRLSGLPRACRLPACQVAVRGVSYWHSECRWRAGQLLQILL